MERRHSGAVTTAARVGGGGGEAEGPGNLGRAEGTPGPTTHGSLQRALRRQLSGGEGTWAEVVLWLVGRGSLEHSSTLR
jgi:hypothetical protein